MPVRQDAEGKWWWGKQGPFDTEAKARQVERAAYANGYKGTRKTKKTTSTRKKVKRK